MPINLGDRFISFSGFRGALEIFKAETNSDFYICDSKTLEYGKRKFSRRYANAPDILKYSMLKYRCVHGGTFRRNKMSRNLRNTSTTKLGCEAFICLSLSDDAKALVIKSMYLEHNHDSTGALYTYVSRHQRPGNRHMLRLKVKDANGMKQMPKNKEKYLVQKKISQESEDEDISVSVTRDLRNFDAPNEDAQMAGPYETEMMDNSAGNASHSLREGTKSGVHKLCRCEIGTWELTKQDLMLMEVEEHHQRLEILQLQEAYQIERIEKMRYLHDLKIQKEELELSSKQKT